MDHTQPFESAISGGILPCVALLARRLDSMRTPTRRTWT